MTKDIIGKHTTLIDEIYQDRMIPLIKKQAKQIDDDIRGCIKREIKERGSIVRRYGDWAKFIGEEIGIGHYPTNQKHLFHNVLFYRGQQIREYVIKYID